MKQYFNNFRMITVSGLYIFGKLQYICFAKFKDE